MRFKISMCIGLLFCMLSTIAQPPIGIQCPEISLKDINGNLVTISSLKGKVVIIDFWASWCGPCRAANRTLRKLYNKYKDAGLEIYSISTDYTMKPWLRAVKADKMNWIQVFDEGNLVSNKWRIGYLPFTFVLDKTGKIVNANLDASELEDVVKKYL